MPDGPKPFRTTLFLSLLAAASWRAVTGARYGGTSTGAQLGELVSPSGAAYVLHVDPGATGEGSIAWTLATSLPAHRQPHLLTEASFTAAKNGAAIAMDWDGVRAVATAG